MQLSHTPLIDIQLFNRSSTDGISVDKHHFRMKRAICPAVHLGTTRHFLKKKVVPILFTHLEDVTLGIYIENPKFAECEEIF